MFVCLRTAIFFFLSRTDIRNFLSSLFANKGLFSKLEAPIWKQTSIHAKVWNLEPITWDIPFFVRIPERLPVSAQLSSTQGADNERRFFCFRRITTSLILFVFIMAHGTLHLYLWRLKWHCLGIHK